VLAHGGTVSLQNPAGGGAEFIVQLPTAQDPERLNRPENPLHQVN
jgi:signal transduction histidine kinase